MSDGPRPEFEPSDQQLDGADRTSGQPPAEPPERPAETAEPRSARTARTPWLLGVGAVAVVTVGGAAWALSAAGGESEPARFTSMPEPCALVPGMTLEQHVPNSQAPVPRKADTSPTERYASCEWTEPPIGPAGATTFTAHRLNIAVRLHLDGMRQAESEYDAAWLGARSMAGTAKGAGGSLHAEAPALTEIGDRAFIQYLTLKGPLGQSGTATTTVRLRNAVITVRYRGTTSRLGKDGSPEAGTSKALDEAAARSGAETIAKGITGTLANCADCLTR